MWIDTVIIFLVTPMVDWITDHYRGSNSFDDDDVRIFRGRRFSNFYQFGNQKYEI